MRPTLRCVPVITAFALLAACSHPRPTVERPPDPDPRERAYLDEFCGQWAETVWGPGREALFDAFVARARALPPADVSDLPFRVLLTPERSQCWRISAQVIGFAGTPDDGLRLAALIHDARMPPHVHRHGDAILYGRVADLTHGLAFLAARLGEADPVARHIEDLLLACAEPAFWVDATPPRVEPISDDPAVAVGERRAYAGRAMRRCIHALGNTGSARAGETLRAGARGLPWHAHYPMVDVDDYTFALRKHALISTYGLDGMLARGHAAKL